MQNPVVATRNPQFTTKWQQILEAQVTVFSSLQELEQFLRIREVGHVVVDMTLPNTDDESLLRRVISQKKHALFILDGVEFTPEMEVAAMALGASFCCPPQMPLEECKRIVDAVSRKGVWFSAKALAILFKNMQGFVKQPIVTSSKEDLKKIERLTQRENQIAKLVAEGKNNREISENLSITERTTKAHLTSIFDKLDLQNRSQLTALWTRTHS